MIGKKPLQEDLLPKRSIKNDDEITKCIGCGCMTKTIKGRCGKCQYPKGESAAYPSVAPSDDAIVEKVLKEFGWYDNPKEEECDTLAFEIETHTAQETMEQINISIERALKSAISARDAEWKAKVEKMELCRAKLGNFKIIPGALGDNYTFRFTTPKFNRHLIQQRISDMKEGDSVYIVFKSDLKWMKGGDAKPEKDEKVMEGIG